MRWNILFFLSVTMTVVAKHHVIGFAPNSADLQREELPMIQELAYDFAPRKERALFVIEGDSTPTESPDLWYERAANVHNVAVFYGVPPQAIKIIQSHRRCRQGGHAARVLFLKHPALKEEQSHNRHDYHFTM